MKPEKCPKCDSINFHFVYAPGKTEPVGYRCYICQEWIDNSIPLFEGRPKRDEPIGRDDIVNLKIWINDPNLWVSPEEVNKKTTPDSTAL